MSHMLHAAYLLSYSLPNIFITSSQVIHSPTFIFSTLSPKLSKDLLPNTFINYIPKF